MLKVSKDDYFIFLTPEGELYDKSVIPGNDEITSMNIKRESKVYSYKEQQEELQLRRELEEKKRKEGKIKEPQYTQKQLEIIKAQRDKENVIRNRLVELNKVLQNCVSLIQSLARGNPHFLALHFKELLPSILEACQSPLAAPYLTKLFIEMRYTIFNRQDTLSDLISHLTLRLLNPQCDLDPNWESEEVRKSVSRSVSLIFAHTKDKEMFCAPGFCYMFPFLKMSLMSRFARDDEGIVASGLKILAEHAKMRGSGVKGDMFHPKYLPRRQMFSLLVELISKYNFSVILHPLFKRYSKTEF